MAERPAVAWPLKGSLAKAWEQNPVVRELFRENKWQLLAWPKVELVGVASLRSLSLNRRSIQDAIRIWSEFSATPKSPPIDWLKQEARDISHSTVGTAEHMYQPDAAGWGALPDAHQRSLSGSNGKNLCGCLGLQAPYEPAHSALGGSDTCLEGPWACKVV